MTESPRRNNRLSVTRGSTVPPPGSSPTAMPGRAVGNGKGNDVVSGIVVVATDSIGGMPIAVVAVPAAEAAVLVGAAGDGWASGGEPAWLLLVQATSSVVRRRTAALRRTAPLN
jgi:hypothetical protein